MSEHLAAAKAGNSPTMVHSHYKGLATRAEVEKWLAVAQARVANVIPLAAVAKHAIAHAGADPDRCNHDGQTTQR